MLEIRLTGEEGRDLDWGNTNGFVVSNGPVDSFEVFVGAPGAREERFGGDPSETPFMALRREGVRGVFTSERERWREGVLGFENMARTSQRDGDREKFVTQVFRGEGESAMIPNEFERGGEVFNIIHVTAFGSITLRFR